MAAAKSALAVAVFAGSLSAARGALAQEAGFYLGAALGQAKFKEWCVSDPSVLACDDKAGAWKILGGYRFNRHVAIEGTYIDWGEASGRVSGPPVTDVSADNSSMGIAAVGSLDLGPRFSAFGKAGLLRTEQERRTASATSSASAKGDETEFHFGFGARFALTPNWGARFEWERTNKLKVEMIAVGVEYRF